MNYKPIKLLIIGKVWPEPDSSAAGSRMMELIEVFQNEGWNITYATAASESNYAINLEDYGVRQAHIKLNSASFDEFIQKLSPDVVMFDRFMTEEQFGWRVAEQCPEAVRILDTEDLHCLREARYQAWKERREFRESDLLNELAKREVASILRCDLSLIISSFEMELLNRVFKIEDSLILELPFMLDELSEEAISNWMPFNNREHFISIGNFLHEPNWNAVLFLKEEIWPLIRKQLPQTELHIYGAYPSQKVQQLHNEKEGFLVKGRAEDAKEVVGASRVLLAPLRFGAGLKGKLIEAMQCGTPSVTTEIGAEAMHRNLPWPGAVHNKPEAIAQTAVELYRDEGKWREVQEKGKPIINQLYDKRELGNKLIGRILGIREKLKSHRSENFIGQILHHHSAASTKYMSKWIEAKNDR